MGWLRRERGYDRARVLAQATQAVRKRKPAKALSYYQQILTHEPKNPELHRRVAPLLARTGQGAEAWASYQRAAESMLQRGFVDQAIGVYREASQQLPRQSETWLALASLEVERGRPRDAVEALKNGRRRFRSRRDRPEALRLLRRAREVDPSDFEIGFELAGLCAASGLRRQAVRLLAELATAASRSQLRRIRRRQFALSPGLGSGWRWLRALFGAERPGRARLAA